MRKDGRKARAQAPKKTMTAAHISAAVGIGRFGSLDRAETLSKMLRDNLDAVRKELLRAPIDDAFTLLVLLGLERERGVSAGESQAMELRRRQLSAAGKKGAELRHNKLGGARAKAEEIRAIWATGKYSTRELCAEQECAALNMKYGTARKALYNTPNPS